MNSAPHSPSSRETLRLRAEQCRESGGVPFNSPPAKAEDAQRLLHELEVHQIELEMQNLELRNARDEAEHARHTYQQLYDFAPAGYFTLSREGDVLMANLTGASLLGIERDTLPGSSFRQWVVPGNQRDFDKFLTGIFKRPDTVSIPVSIEVKILKPSGETFIAGLEARKEAADRECRMMMTDISRQKAGEEADRLLKISNRSNQKLQREVVHRQEVEMTLESARDKLDKSLEKSEQQRKKLRRLTHALLDAQEKERKRISRELHDGIVQTLVAIQFEFELLSRDSMNRFPGLQDQISRTQDILEKSIDLVHGFAFDLRPSVLDNLGLRPALKAFASRFHQSSGIEVVLDLHREMDHIGFPERSMLYRVVQEAFHNITTHAQAQKVHLRIAKEPTGIRMEITDDGIGMDTEKAAPPLGEGRLGLIGMKERVEMQGGLFDLHSRPGEYTTIQVDLPASCLQEHPLPMEGK